MRRESSTVVALVGEVGEGLLAELGRSPNVSIARAPGAGTGQPDAAEPPGARPGWEAGALALREAARRVSAYVVVPGDPLAEVAAAWRAMWDVSDTQGAAGFEESAADALTAWRGQRVEPPHYYLGVAAAPPRGTRPDPYPGPLPAPPPPPGGAAGLAGRPGKAARVRAALRSLEHGPWWPPLDELIDVARRFYAGGLAETQSPPGRPTPAQPASA